MVVTQTLIVCTTTVHLDANEIQCVDDTGGEGLTSAFTSTECFLFFSALAFTC